MSVQRRIFIPMLIAAMVVAAAVLSGSALVFSQTIEERMRNEQLVMMRVAKSELNHMLEAARLAALHIAHDEHLVRAMESHGAPDAALLETLYDELAVELCVLVDKDGLVITSLHETNNVGDDLSSLPNVAAALNGEEYTSLGLGVYLSLTASSAVPIFGRDGELLAAVVTGYRLDTDAIVDSIQALTGFEVSLYKNMEQVATTIRYDDGRRASDIKPPVQGRHQAIRNKHDVHGWDVVLGREILSLYSPLTDRNDTVIGMILLGKYPTERTEAVRSFVMTGMGIAAIIIALCAVVIWKVVKQISKPIKDSMDKILFDPLTGLHNRRYLNEKLDNAIKSLSRSNSFLSVLMLDIDCFKLYNDNYGHAEGDKCLKMVADVLTRCIDRADDFIVRYGGEEFTVVLPNTNEAGAKKIAAKILERIRARKMPHEKSIVAGYVTLSIGVVSGKVLPGHSAEDYIKQADELLYMSKQNGRNRYTFKNF